MIAASQEQLDPSKEPGSSGEQNDTAVEQVQIDNCRSITPITSVSIPDQLIGVLTERNVNNGTTKRQQICLEPKAKVPRKGENSNYVQVQVHRQIPIHRKHTAGKSSNNAPGKPKIPRPANAFMLFANEWRKKLALENPRESNKDISVRLVYFYITIFLHSHHG